jgi:[ribosomal protein S18]-alanine N-acetyltransferase
VDGTMAIQEQQTLFFRPLTMDHIPHVLRIERDAYPEPWTFNMLRDEVDQVARYFCLMYDKDVLAGYGGYWLLLDEAHITRVTIVRDRRGCGLSKMLMEHILTQAKSAGACVARLEVRENNIYAIRLYEGLGFIRDGLRKGYYQHTNENALLMSKEL